jgi:hypothetical protein
MKGLTAYKGASQLRKYIQNCPNCLTNNPRRRKTYGSLQPIMTPPTPFGTVTMDFMTHLPADEHGRNKLLVFVDKSTKRIGLLLGYDRRSAADWGYELLAHLQGTDWPVPRSIISDRDPIFMAGLWKDIFKRLGVQWLYSSAYHPQTDGTIERNNQTVEIMLRHSLTKRPQTYLTIFLPHIVSVIKFLSIPHDWRDSSQAHVWNRLQTTMEINHRDAASREAL